jgi:hypothetical protein
MAAQIAFKTKMDDPNQRYIGLLKEDSALFELRKLRKAYVIKEILAAKKCNAIDNPVLKSTLPIQIDAVNAYIDSIIRYLTNWKVPIKDLLYTIELTDEELTSLNL